MNFQKRFSAPALAAVVTVTLFANGRGMIGQTAPVAAIGTKMPVAGFQSAPAFKLSDIPSGVVSTDLDGDGKPDVVVAFAATGKVVVYLGIGRGRFQAPVEYSVGGHPEALAAVDLNGDGQPDIVTANGADGTVSVLLGGAGGKLGTAKVSPVGVDANYLAATDLNGDGTPDIAVASRTGQALAILLNDRHGALQASTVQALGKAPTGLVTGDFNGDRHIDAAVSNDDGTVSVLLGAGDGTLRMAGSIAVSGGKILSMATADFNRDGNPDLAVTQADGRLLTTLIGKGDGTFATGTSYLVGNMPIFTAAVDVNGDGFADLVTVNQGSNTVSVLLGNGDASFQNARNFAVGGGPASVATGDFYSTGFAALVVVDASARTLNAIAGKGDGTFRAAPSYSGGLNPRAIASGDLNGDGLPDLVVTNFCGSDAQCATGGTLSIYLGQASGGYKLASTQAVGAGPVSVALADLNGDGNLDVVALNRAEKTFSVLLGVGDGTLREPLTAALVGSPVAVVAKDFNQDGQIDLAVLTDCGSAKCTQPGSVEVYFGGGDGSFDLGASYAVSYSPRSIASGDVNGDGMLDLVVANACGKDASCSSAGTATVLLGGAQGSFAAQAEIALKNGPSSIALWSAKSKGVLDIVVTHEADSTVAVLKGKGDGTFQTPALYAVGGSPVAIAVADLNGDGTPDVAVANARDSTVSVLYGRADGTLVAGGSYAVAAGPEALTVVSSTAGAPASLVTANGNTASTPVGSEITLLANASPNVGLTPSSTSLAVTATNPTVNGSVTLTATVTDSNLVPLPGESVVFSSDGTTSSDNTTITDCGNPTTDVNGVASCTTSELIAGSRTLTATFNGDATFAASSGQQTQSISMANTTISLTSPSTPMVNQPVTYSATLNGTFTPTVPSQTITFSRLDGTAIPGCPVTTLSGTVPSPTCTITPTAAGAPDIMVSYSGDNNFSLSSGTSSQPVSTIPATLTLVVPDPNAVVTVNQPVTFTANFSTGNATITPTAPNGTIAFTVTGAIVSACAPTTPVTTATATATCTVTPTATGSLSVTAAYTDANYSVATTTNSPVAQTVSKIPATLSLSGPASAMTVNQPVTFTANFSTGNAAITPTGPNGTIAFTVTGAIVSACAPTTPVTTATATATCTVTPTAAGSLSVAAAYTDANYVVATTANSPVAQTVSKIPATLSLSGPASAMTVNQPVTFTANFSTGNAAITPTGPNGTIAFTVTGAIVSACAPTTPVTTATATATCTVTPTAAGSLSVAAAYTDANYSVATSTNSPVAQTVSKIPATLSLSGPASAMTVNQPVTFTANFSTGNAAITPTGPNGTIAFTVTGAIASACAPTTPVTTATATATCTVTPTAAGSLSVAAAYTDANYSVATTTNSPVAQTVKQIPATLSLSNPPSVMTVNQPVTFTANFSTGNAPITPTPPNGTITFAVTGAIVSACAPTTPVTTAAATATCTVIPTAAGSLTVTASYADTNYIVAAPTPAFLIQTVNKITPTLSVSSNPSPAAVNQTVTYTATVVSPAPGMTLPMGSVTFTQAGASVCGLQGLTPSAASPTTSATATCPVTFTSQGTSSAVTATYNGDSNFTPPTPSPTTTAASFTVAPATTATTLTSTGSANTPVVNQNVTFTATITPQFTGGAILGGAVTFTDQASALTICSSVAVTVTNSIGMASCTMPLLSQGPHNIQAAFTSSSQNFGSSSITLAQMVNPENSAISLSASPASVPVNQQVTFTATVTKADSTFPGNASPQGSVGFAENGASIGTCGAVALTSGTATCTLPFTSATTHNITATFTSSTPANFINASTAVAEVVTQAPTTLTLTALPAPSSVNQPVVFTAVLTPLPTGSSPTGSITFTETQTGTSGNILCPSVNLVASPGGSVTASCSATFLTAGAHQVQATYATDGNFMSNTASIMQTVKLTNVTVTVSSMQTASVVNQPVAFTISLTSTLPGTAKPQGIVTLTDNALNKVLCSQTVMTDGSVPPCTTSFTVVGTHSISASFAPSDLNFSPSNALNITQMVQAATTVLTVASSSGVSSPSSVATQLVTFTATVVPAFTGAAAPSGTVAFTLTGDTVDTCSTASVTTSAPYMATCMITFSNSITGSVTIRATYTPTAAPGGANFQASTGTAAQNVQNFRPALTATSLPAGIVPVGSAIASPIVTQGFSNLTDPFNPTTITVASSPGASFVDMVAVTKCTATNSAGVNLDSSFCTIAGLVNTGNGNVATLALSPTTSTPIGAYTLAVTAVDSKVPTLTYTMTLLVNVAPQVATSSLIAGATTGAINVPFGVPSGSVGDTFSFACGAVTYNGSPTAAITCTTANPPVVTLAGAPFTITASTAHAMAIPVRGPSQRIFAAALVGVPLFAFVGCIGRKGSRKSFLRFLAALTVVAVASQAIGCGGGFVTTSVAGSSSGPAVGTYLVLVTATDTRTQLTYDAVIIVAIKSAAGS